MAPTVWTKLHASIVNSSLNDLDLATFKLFMIMLSQGYPDGKVIMTETALALAARLTEEQCQQSLIILMSPDRHSRTPNSASGEIVNKLSEMSTSVNKRKQTDLLTGVVDTGYRVEEIQGGWRILNYALYKKKGRSVDRREYMKLAQRKYRAKKRAAKKQPVSTTHVNTCQPVLTNKEVDTNLPIVLNGDAVPERANPATGSERDLPRDSFQEFWSSFPHPEKIFYSRAEKSWRGGRLDSIAGQVMDCLTKWKDYWLNNPGDREMAYLWLRRKPWLDDYVGPLEPDPAGDDDPSEDEVDRQMGWGKYGDGTDG